MTAVGVYDQIKKAFQDVIAPELHALRGDIRAEWLTDARRIGITAGASTPEILVTQTVEALRGRGGAVREVHVVEEDVRFALPQELAHMAKERGMTLPSRTAMRQSI